MTTTLLLKKIDFVNSIHLSETLFVVLKIVFLLIIVSNEVRFCLPGSFNKRNLKIWWKDFPRLIRQLLLQSDCVNHNRVVPHLRNLANQTMHMRSHLSKSQQKCSVILGRPWQFLFLVLLATRTALCTQAQCKL